MAGMKSLYPLLGTNNPGTAIVAGGFVVNGASAPTSLFGTRFSVSAPATGVYTITLLDGPIAGLLAIIPQIADPAANSTARVNPVGGAPLLTLATTGQFQLVTQSAAGTDANLAGSQVVFFALIVKNTNATR